MLILSARFGGLIRNRRQYTVSVFSVWTLFLSFSNVSTIIKWRNAVGMFWFIRIGKSHSFRDSIFWILFFLNRNRNSQDSPKIMRLSLFFRLCTHFKSCPASANLDVFAFKISNSKTFFLKLVQASLLSHYRIRPTKEVELSQCVGMSWLLHECLISRR